MIAPCRAGMRRISNQPRAHSASVLRSLYADGLRLNARLCLCVPRDYQPARISAIFVLSHGSFECIGSQHRCPCLLWSGGGALLRPIRFISWHRTSHGPVLLHFWSASMPVLGALLYWDSANCDQVRRSLEPNTYFKFASMHAVLLERAFVEPTMLLYDKRGKWASCGAMCRHFDRLAARL